MANPYFQGYPNTGVYGATQYNQQAMQPMQSYGNNTQYYNPLIGVVGKAGAESYPIAPGNTIVLADTDPNSGLLFVKSRDAFGNTPVIEVYKRVSVSGNQNGSNSVSNPDYVTSDSFNELQKTVNEIKRTIDELVK